MEFDAGTKFGWENLGIFFFSFGIGGKIALWFKICCHYRFTGRTIKNVINMGSYNYLGFAETDVNALKTVTIELEKYGTGVCSTRQEMGE